MLSIQNHRRSAGFVAVLSLAIVWPAAAQDPTAKIRAEIERLQSTLKDQQAFAAAGLPNMRAQIQEGLKRTSEALRDGRIYASLEQLAQSINFVEGSRVVIESGPAVEKGGLPAFEAEWNKTRVMLTALEKETRERDASGSTAAILALSQTVQTRSVPILDGARGFATSTSPADGLLYVGLSRGEAHFVRFCASLGLAPKGSSLRVRSMLPELQALQEKTTAAFQPPKSIDQHPIFIALNATLKVARELDASKFYQGSLYQYLDGVRQFGLLDATEPDAAGQAALKPALATLRKKYAASSRDDSIALFFVERAESFLDAGEWKNAKVIVEDVLPAYQTALERATASPLKAQTKTVDLTLVRWPYT